MASLGTYVDFIALCAYLVWEIEPFLHFRRLKVEVELAGSGVHVKECIAGVSDACSYQVRAVHFNDCDGG